MKIRLNYILIVLLLTMMLVNVYGQKDATKSTNQLVSTTAKTYQEDIASGVVLVDYWAVWCGPCRKMEPTLQEVATETKVRVLKLNVDDYTAFVRQQKIDIIPTMIIYKDGLEVERLNGVYAKSDLIRVLNKYL
ncbi:MAG: thioredoxin [Bacteroidota bacterium]